MSDEIKSKRKITFYGEHAIPKGASDWWVSGKDYGELEKKNTHLREQNGILQEQNERYKSERDAALSELSILHGVNRVFLKTAPAMNHLIEENAQLREQIEQLKMYASNKHEKLTNYLAKNREIAQLREQNAQLQKDLDEARRIACQLELQLNIEHGNIGKNVHVIARERGWDCFEDTK